MAKRVETCKECLKYKICHRIDNEIAYNRKGRTLQQIESDLGSTCHMFLNKSNFVEVVRCKDCKHSRNCDDNDGVIMCILNSEKDEETDIDCGFLSFHSKNHFCSYGERVIK